MLERLLLTVGIVVAGILGYRLLKEIQLRRRASRTLGIPGYRSGAATILYFTAPGCAPCRTVQKPALANIKERYGDNVNVLQFDATEHTNLADSWGVLSVPTTFIIDAAGRPRGVNHGLAREGKLEAQLLSVGVDKVSELSTKRAQLAHGQER